MKKDKFKRASKANPDTQMQAGPRSTSYTELNYRSVNTVSPNRLASAFMQADQGYITHQAALYEMIEEQDAHIYSELAKRKRAVTSLGWQLKVPDDANQSELDRTKELEDMVRGIDHIEDTQFDLFDAIGKGFSALEIEWKTGDVWLPKCIHFVPQRNFELAHKTGELLYLNNGVAEPLNPDTWVIHNQKSKSGYIEQAALFRVLAWTYAYKAYNIKDMQRFLELYGIPLRLGKYPAGIDKTSRDALLRAVRNIGNDGAGVVPSNMMIDFIRADAKGNVADFLSAIEYWEAKQSKAILGGELDGKTTTEARIMMYDKVRREILLHDVRQAEPTLNNGLLKRINVFNGMFAADRMPVWSYLTQESVDQQKMIGVLEKGAALGMQIEVEYAHEILQIPQAKDGAAVLGKPKPSPEDKPQANQNEPEQTDTDPSQGALSRLAALASKQGALAHLTDAYTAQLAALGAKHEAELVQKIAAVVAEAGDFDEAIAGIEALAVDFKVPALAEVIALGMAASHLGGIDEIKSQDS